MRHSAPGELVPERSSSGFRGSPLIAVFHAANWDPATQEHIALYNRLVDSLPGAAAARLVHLRTNGVWHELAFQHDTVALPVVVDDDEIASRLGVGDEPAVVVLDADGSVRWRHDGRGPADPVALGRALSEASGASQPRSTWSRREFVATALGVTIAIALEPKFARAESAVQTLGAAAPGAARRVTLNVNGKDITLQLEPRVSLLDALREYANMNGTKKGCDHGQCGACTVHLDGRRALSCLSLAVMQQGKKITTIEGLAKADTLHPMQQAFITHDGFQCGYCTPGQIMSATAMLDEPWGSSDDDVREAMSGNICRCGAYVGIVAAIQEVRSARRAAQ